MPAPMEDAALQPAEGRTLESRPSQDMYQRYARRFEAELASRGPLFARRVEMYKSAVAAVQPLWRKVPRRQMLCRFQAGRIPLKQRLLNTSSLRCPFGAGAPPAGGTLPEPRGAIAAAVPTATASTSTSSDSFATPPTAAHTVACASLYAHRLFECPWQYVPNGVITDALGCWRPSTGMK